MRQAENHFQKVGNKKGKLQRNCNNSGTRSSCVPNTEDISLKKGIQDGPAGLQAWPETMPDERWVWAASFLVFTNL
jgi:hypothetical protein